MFTRWLRSDLHGYCGIHVELKTLLMLSSIVFK